MSFVTIVKTSLLCPPFSWSH